MKPDVLRIDGMHTGCREQRIDPDQIRSQVCFDAMYLRQSLANNFRGEAPALLRRRAGIAYARLDRKSVV